MNGLGQAKFYTPVGEGFALQTDTVDRYSRDSFVTLRCVFSDLRKIDVFTERWGVPTVEIQRALE
jgi:hypothetical protein